MEGLALDHQDQFIYTNQVIFLQFFRAGILHYQVEFDK